MAAIERALTSDPPSGAKVTWSNVKGSTGWDAPAYEPWLEAALGEAAESYFGKPAIGLGEGGTIPFMNMLGRRFPQAQFQITGVLGAHLSWQWAKDIEHEIFVPVGRSRTVDPVIVSSTGAVLLGPPDLLGQTLDLPSLSAAQQLAQKLQEMPEVTNYQIYAGTSAPITFNGLVRHYYLRQAPNTGGRATTAVSMPGSRMSMP